MISCKISGFDYERVRCLYSANVYVVAEKLFCARVVGKFIEFMREFALDVFFFENCE